MREYIPLHRISTIPIKPMEIVQLWIYFDQNRFFLWLRGLFSIDFFPHAFWLREFNLIIFYEIPFYLDGNPLGEG
jgi:hypothetical protein